MSDEELFSEDSYEFEFEEEENDNDGTGDENNAINEDGEDEGIVCGKGNVSIETDTNFLLGKSILHGQKPQRRWDR